MYNRNKNLVRTAIRHQNKSVVTEIAKPTPLHWVTEMCLDRPDESAALITDLMIECDARRQFMIKLRKRNVFGKVWFLLVGR